jgi:hypothetical protein
MEMINQYGYHFSVPDWLSQVPKQNTTERTAGWKQYLYFNHVQQVGPTTQPHQHALPANPMLAHDSVAPTQVYFQYLSALYFAGPG